MARPINKVKTVKSRCVVDPAFRDTVLNNWSAVEAEYGAFTAAEKQECQDFARSLSGTNDQKIKNAKLNPLVIDW